jgi:hypothetical protein
LQYRRNLGPWDQWFKRADTALFHACVSGRNQVQRAPEAPRRAGIGESVAANFVQLSWHAAYECGNAVIDDQHKALFGDANDLLAAILSERPADEVATLIDALITPMARHFEDQEAIINATGFPGAQSHDVVARHMLGADREFFPFVKAAEG